MLTWWHELNIVQSEDGKEKISLKVQRTSRSPSVQRTSRSPSLQEQLVRPQRFFACIFFKQYFSLHDQQFVCFGRVPPIAGGYNVSCSKGVHNFTYVLLCYSVWWSAKVSVANDNLRHKLYLTIVDLWSLISIASDCILGAQKYPSSASKLVKLFVTYCWETEQLPHFCPLSFFCRGLALKGQLAVIKETSTISRTNVSPCETQVERRTTSTTSTSRSSSRGKRPSTVPKEPNFHSIHVPKSCTKTPANVISWLHHDFYSSCSLVIYVLSLDRQSCFVVHMQDFFTDRSLMSCSKIIFIVSCLL